MPSTYEQKFTELFTRINNYFNTLNNRKYSITNPQLTVTNNKGEWTIMVPILTDEDNDIHVTVYKGIKKVEPLKIQVLSPVVHITLLSTSASIPANKYRAVITK